MIALKEIVDNVHSTSLSLHNAKGNGKEGEE